jgi:hypothetical protein
VVRVTAATVSAEVRSLPCYLPSRFSLTATAGSVAGVTPSPGSPPTIGGYEPIPEALRVLALDTVRDRELSRNGRTYVMQSVLAFQVDRLWSRVLDHLSDGELLALCPACRKDLYVVVGQYGFFVAAGGMDSEF